MALALGLFTKPVYAEGGSIDLAGKYIQSIVNRKSAPKWDEKIAPQLARRDAQVAEAQRQAQIAAEAEAARVAAEQAAAQAAIPAPVRAAVSGNCGSWMAAAGVTDIASASWIISRESGCNPNAVNASSGACGIAQELPCGKSGCPLGDPVCQIRWMQQYVTSRYGGWAGAVAFWQSHNWY